MASLRTKLEDELECSMCLERLKDPRVFPCQHSFCYQCIVDLSQGNSKISCPECRAEVEVGDPPDLSHFKRNHRINNILECIDNARERNTNSEGYQESKTSQTSKCSDGTAQKTQTGANQSRNDGQQLPQNESSEENSVEKLGEMKAEHKIGDRVWVYINEKPSAGFIRYIGRIRGGKEITAGIVLDNPVGQGNGEYFGKRLFSCPMNHAYFIPIENVISHENLRELYSQPTNARAASSSDPKSPTLMNCQLTNSPLQRNLNIGSEVNVLSQTQRAQYDVPGRPGNIPLKRKVLTTGTNDDVNTRRYYSLRKNAMDVPLINSSKLSKIFYILLKDTIGEKQAKVHASNERKKCFTLLKGTILYQDPADLKKSDLIRLYCYENPSYFIDCSAKDVDKIDEEEARLFLTFASIDERFKFYKENSLNEIKSRKNMTIGTNVYVKVRSPSGGIQEIRGIIKYKGPLPDELGTMFGVELMDGRGWGSTNGKFKGKRYFKCDPHCGVFVSIEKVRLCEGVTKEAKDADEDNSSVFTKLKNKIVDFVLGEQIPEESSLEKNSLDKMMAGPKIDDRVWVSVNDKLCGGLIMYTGRIPGGKEILAGIYLDNPVGRGDGEYYGRQLFTCPMNHAWFTPIENVISDEKLREVFDQPPDVRVSSSSAPQTEADIVAMESKFSKRSEEQVIKEQEELLRKIKEEHRKSQK